MDERFATLNGIRINYGEGRPNGPVLVVAGGFPYNRTRYPWAESLQLAGMDHQLRLSTDPGPVVAAIEGFFAALDR